MIHSKNLQDNPNLFVFLPIFYVAWSDTVLTPAEISTLQNLIEGQSWLKGDEKKFLLEQLDPASPPSPDDFKSWLIEIKKVLNPTSTEQNESLVEIGIRLAKLKGGANWNGTLPQAKESLQKLEDSLGL